MHSHQYGTIASSMNYDSLSKIESADDTEEINDEMYEPFSNHKRYYSITGILSLAMIGIIILAAIVQIPTPILPVSIRFSTSSGLSITVSNEYGEVSTTKYPYDFLKNNLFAETYKDNSFTISDTSSDCDYYYTITGVTDTSYSTEGTASNSVFTFKPLSPGKYSLLVSEICSGIKGRTYSKTVWSKYVRRELSSLTDNDRESFLNAFKTLWEVSTVDGKAIYGDNYKGLYHFAVIHNDAGSSPILACDEFHGNTGFINNHVMLGAYLEQSLQLVDPSVSLHYMAYMKYFSSSAFTTHQQSSLDGGTWTDVMTSKFFGSNDPITGRILDGRWANLTIPYVTDAFLESEDVSITSTFFPQEESKILSKRSTPHTYSPYGLLRSPWNYNPSTYLARYNNVDRISDISNIANLFYEGVTCSVYNSYINAIKGSSMKEFLYTVENGIHGDFHFTIAGTGGDYAQNTNHQFRTNYKFTDANIVVTDNSAHDFFKSFIQFSGDTTPYLICSNDAWDSNTQTLRTSAGPGEVNGPSCQCNSSYTSSSAGLSSLTTAFYAFWVNPDDEMQEEAKTLEKAMQLSDDLKKSFLESLCSRYLLEGDLAGSSAAIDPLFWVAHGSVEKLFQKMVFENWLSDWIYSSENDGTCSGHDSAGTKYWLSGFQFGNKSIDASTVTNTELIEILNPSSSLYQENINFIYDHSDWSTICEDDDIVLFSS